jgi:hypothetical protein
LAHKGDALAQKRNAMADMRHALPDKRRTQMENRRTSAPIRNPSGSGEPLLPSPSTPIAPESLPWRGEKKRGRKETAPTVDTVAHLPTLSVPGSGSGTSPLQGGDSGPTVSAQGSTFFSCKARRPPPSLSPGEGEKKRGRKEMVPDEESFSVPSSCPSPSGEGTRGPRRSRQTT